MKVNVGRWQQVVLPVLAVLTSLAIGSVFIIFANASPLPAYRSLFRAGFGCRGPGGTCAFLTTLQYATPLILSGLSATVAFRAGMFSIGQAGQMVVGAAAATFLAGSLALPAPLQAIVAITGGIIGGAFWGFVPGLLKATLNVSEVIVTLLMNPMAILLAGPVSWWRIPESARLLPLVPTTKLNPGFIIAIGAAAFIYLQLWRSSSGYEQRMSGQSTRFAHFGGIHTKRAVVRAMAMSGGLAGLAGAIEVLGVHYRFISTFSAIDQFDGVVVALLGQQHPLGIVFSSILLGGVRLGAVNGLQLEAHVPRELGSALIALMVLFISSPKLYSRFFRRQQLPAD
ncbi:MAG: ABC transporter permease [Chloroflexota bacterium]